MKLGLHHFL